MELKFKGTHTHKKTQEFASSIPQQNEYREGDCIKMTKAILKKYKTE